MCYHFCVIYLFIYYFVSMKLISSFLLIVVDKENVKPPVIEGLDTLVAVSSVFLSHLCLITKIMIFSLIVFCTAN